MNMNLWAVSSMPVYVPPTAEREPGKRRKSEKRAIPPIVTEDHSTIPFPALPAELLHHPDDHELLEPAVDGPPSPESLRALNNQMRRASIRDKHQSHHTTSSGSSSLRSLSSAERPSWENAIEGFGLSRKSSGRSVSSSMPNRDRPESVQIFGKTLFNRRGKLKRESSALNSSGSSLYSVEAPADAVPPVPTSAPSVRDSTRTGIFSRRRTLKAENADDSAAQRKIQISGPYNFQHVAHTQKDSVSDLQRTTSQLRTSQMAGTGTGHGARTDEMHFADFSSESLPMNEGDVVVSPDLYQQRTAPAPAPAPAPRPPSTAFRYPTSPPRRLVNRTQSSEQLGRAPPRPPRSPIENSFVPAGPVPPPRVSSRMSTRHDRFDSVGSIYERPQTSSGFCHPQPLVLTSDAVSPPTSSHGYTPGPDMDMIPEHSRTNSRISNPPDDLNWPLPCPTATLSFDATASLPALPEEEETVAPFRPTRASVISNSSLRGSQSVPMLRAFSVQNVAKEEDNRPSSGASDTLGRFDLFAAQRALKAALVESEESDPLPRECWEDDIDYCYDHAAEADCDYAWERPSLDISRDGESATPVEDQYRNIPSCEVSPAMLSPAQFDLPSLSPVSQVSNATAHEAITPTDTTLRKASNFSLPRVETPQKDLLHVRRASNASSFKESHGFTLSPSLLIPADFKQQMMLNDADDIPDVPEFPPYPHHFGEPAVMSLDSSSSLYAHHRASASTTATFESANSSFERHVSSASTSTDFTRLSLSTSSLDTFDNNYQAPAKPEPAVAVQPRESLHRFPSFESHSRGESRGAMPTLPESEEAAAMTATTTASFPKHQHHYSESPTAISPASPVSARRHHFASRSGSDPNLAKMSENDQVPALGRRKESIQIRRGRARTTSLSTPPPPNQYALFPSVHITGNRI